VQQLVVYKDLAHFDGPQTSPRVGDILVRAWGYERTNIDFFQVVRVLPASVYIRPVAQRSAGDWSVMPVPDEFRRWPLLQVEDFRPRFFRLNKRQPDCSYSITISKSPRTVAIPWAGAPVRESPPEMGH